MDLERRRRRIPPAAQAVGPIFAIIQLTVGVIEHFYQQMFAPIRERRIRERRLREGELDAIVELNPLDELWPPREPEAAGEPVPVPRRKLFTEDTHRTSKRQCINGNFRWPGGMKMRIAESLSNEPWMSDKTFKLLDNQYCISVYRSAPLKQFDPRQEIPLHYYNIPIVVHDCAEPTPVEDLYQDTEEVFDGEDVQRLLKELPGLMRCNHFIDNHVQLVFESPTSKRHAKARFGAFCFTAMNCLFVLSTLDEALCTYELPYESFEQVSNVGDDDELYPGTFLFNSWSGGYTTLGAWLQTNQHADSVTLFTGSLHGFRSKKPLIKYPFSIWSIFLLSLIPRLAYLINSVAHFNPAYYDQALVVCFLYTIWDYAVVYYGKLLGYHKLNGRMATEREIGGLHLLSIYLVPLWICNALQFIITGYPTYPHPLLELFFSLIWFLFLSRTLMYKDKKQVLKMGGLQILSFRAFDTVPLLLVSSLAITIRWLCNLLLLGRRPVFWNNLSCSIFIYALIATFWDLDLGFTYKVVGNPMYSKSGTQIGTCLQHFESHLSNREDNWLHDVTLARFLDPQPSKDGHEIPWGNFEATVVDKVSIYLCSHPVLKGLAVLQGTSYATYLPGKNILWRTNATTITGFSGSLVVWKNAGEWEAIGFQSYEYSSSGNFKVALLPPTELKSQYRCYLPAKVLEKLDAEEEKNGIISLSEWSPIAQERMRNLFS